MSPAHHLLIAQLFSGLTLAANLYASHYSGTISLLSLTNTSDTSYSLTQASSLKGCGSLPSWLTYDAAGKALYCSDEKMSGSATINSFSAGDDLSLKATGSATTPAGGVANVLYGNGFIATAHYQSSSISTHKLPLASGAQPLQTLKFTLSKPGANPNRQEASHPHHVFIDPTGDFLLSPDLGADLIRIYSIDKSSGKLTECPGAATPPGTGPRHGTFWSPSAAAKPALLKGRAMGAAADTFLFVANELQNSVTSWAVTYPSSSGGCLSLTSKQTLTPYSGNAAAKSGTKVAEVRTSGNFLYSSNRNDKQFSPNDSMTQYAISSSGGLTWTAITSAYGTYPRTFAINKAGTLVAIGDQTTANVAIVPRDPATGKLGNQVASLRIGAAGTPENEDGLSSVVWAE